MKFPFVTRSHHEEVVSNLREQIAAAEAERRKLLDRLMVISTGRPIHEMPAEEKKDEVLLEPTEEQKRRSEIASAVVATGSRNPRKIAEWLSAKREREFEDRQKSAPTIPILSEEPSPESARKALLDAVEEGKKLGATA